MGKLLFFLVGFGLVLWWLLRGKPGARDGSERKTSVAEERVLRCGHCGVHVPESEGVFVGERFFCGQAHRQAARK